MIPFLMAAAVGAVNKTVMDSILASEEKFYTTKEISEILGLTEYTVRKKIRDGDIKAEIFPGHAGYRVKQDDLKDYLCQHRGNALQEKMFQTPPESFTIAIQKLEEVINSNHNAVIDPSVIQTFIDGKKIDLEGLNLRLRLLELDDNATADFQRKKISLELAINQLQAEIKACEFVKFAAEKNLDAPKLSDEEKKN